VSLSVSSLLAPSSPGAPTRRLVLLAAGGLALAGCRRKASHIAAGDAAPSLQKGSLAWAVAGGWRSPADRARDAWRHPAQSLAFWGLKPGMTVVEFWPGTGWYTDILAPYLTASKGRLYAANLETDLPGEPASAVVVEAYRRRLSAHPDLYGAVTVTAFGPKTGPVAPAGSADLVLFLRNLHNWMAAGIADKAFRDAYVALKPGGVLGVEEHRAAPGGPPDVMASTGYVQQAYVRQLAKDAGFVFDGASEINANPKDTRDHPFGVWTLPPTRLSAPRGKPARPGFDHARYDAIGESDRMTLRFVKPR
jgi:predicted methyltransferase